MRTAILAGTVMGALTTLAASSATNSIVLGLMCGAIVGGVVAFAMLA